MPKATVKSGLKPYYRHPNLVVTIQVEATLAGTEVVVETTLAVATRRVAKNEKGHCGGQLISNACHICVNPSISQPLYLILKIRVIHAPIAHNCYLRTFPVNV